MKTAVLSVLSIVVLAPAPLAAADEAPQAASSLCSLAPNPLLVDFDFNAQCTITVDCAPFPNKTCTTGGACNGNDRDCSPFVRQRGFVTCDGVTQYCAGPCCGSDSVCEYSYGCGCSDPDCASRPECSCAENGTCNLECGCLKDPDCCTCSLCSSITNCTSDKQCSKDCPGSICTGSGICLCAG